MVTVASVANVLSTQQQAVLALSATGLNSAEVAAALEIPMSEVRAHLARAVTELGAASKLEAVIIALRRGLIELPPETARQPADDVLTSVRSSVRSTDLPRAPTQPGPTRRRLSEQEHEIALLIGAGLKDFVIARRLGLSASTVRTHVRSMRFRLGLTSRAVLVAWVAAHFGPGQPEGGLPA